MESATGWAKYPSSAARDRRAAFANRCSKSSQGEDGHTRRGSRVPPWRWRYDWHETTCLPRPEYPLKDGRASLGQPSIKGMVRVELRRAIFRCPTPRDASDSRRDAACRVSGSWGKMETRHTPVSPGGGTCRVPHWGWL